MHPCLKKELAQTIYVRTPTSYDAGGSEVLSDPVEGKAYIETVTERIIAPEGGREEIQHTMIITEQAITMDDRVYLPGQDTASTKFVQRPKKVVGYNYPHSTRQHHWEVYL